MKCFSIILLLFSISIMAQDNVDSSTSNADVIPSPDEKSLLLDSGITTAPELPTVIPQVKYILSPMQEGSSQLELKTGNIYNLRFKGELNFEQAGVFKNKKVLDVIYIMEVNQDDFGTFFKVFITEPPKKIKDKVSEFGLENIKLKVGKTQGPPDFISLNSNFSLSKEKDFKRVIISVIFTLLILVLIVGIYRFWKKKNSQSYLKKLKRKKANEIIETINRAESRDEIEAIYAYKKDFKKYLSYDEEGMQDFLDQLNKIQYKENWTEEELENIRIFLNKVIPVRIKSGI